MEIEIKKAEIRSPYKLTVDKLYEITLNKEDIKEMLNFGLGGPLVSPRAEDDTQFLLYPTPGEFGKEFAPLPESAALNAYYICIGDPTGDTIEEFVKDIQAKGKIPILLNPLEPNISKRSCRGYVLMKFATSALV